jgi:hypothetical protein
MEIKLQEKYKSLTSNSSSGRLNHLGLEIFPDSALGGSPVRPWGWPLTMTHDQSL